MRLVVSCQNLRIRTNADVSWSGGDSVGGERQLVWTDIVARLSAEAADRLVHAACLEPQETRFAGGGKRTLWWSTAVWLSFTQQMEATPQCKVERVSVFAVIGKDLRADRAIE